MDESNDNFGTDPRKLARTHDPDTSHDAANKVDSRTWEQKVYDFIESRGPAGGTQKDALAHFDGAAYSTITARFKALKEKGLIFDSGRRRDACAVVIATKFAK